MEERGWMMDQTYGIVAMVIYNSVFSLKFNGSVGSQSGWIKLLR